jgi:ABC-2 type transport system permease protein
MDAPPTVKTMKVNRFLPYWAVFQADLKQTFRSWLYRLWVLLSLGLAIGYLLYRYGAKQVAGYDEQASDLMSQVINWIAIGSVTLIIVLTAGAISSERGTAADSVLSRGISRFQYFMGKWHARLIAIMGTFFVMGVIILTTSLCMLHGENMKIMGAVVALVAVTAMLAVVITCGVTVSAITNTTLVSIAIGWMVVNAAGFLLSLLPASYPTPDRVLKNIPFILQGQYEINAIGRLILYSMGVSLFAAVIGMFYFSRRDV